MREMGNETNTFTEMSQTGLTGIRPGFPGPARGKRLSYVTIIRTMSLSAISATGQLSLASSGQVGQQHMD